MSSICEDNHHCHSHSYFSTKNSLKDINLPPRMLLNRSKQPYDQDTPQIITLASDDYEDEADPYSSDEFRMYEFKIRRCMRSRSHDWTDCPFAHPGEKARRRDPRRYHYSGNPCADFRHGTCPRGDTCEFAHGVFECWLHPARYRTHACKDGKGCTRKVCFFAHTPRQLRVLPLSCQSECSSPPSGSISSPCCSYCHCMASSPTSTLMGLSPPLSPKLSPPISPTTSKDGLRGYSLLSRFNEASTPKQKQQQQQQLSLSEYLSYKNALLELVQSLENLGVSSDYEDQQQTQFFLSPTTSSNGSGGSRDIFTDQDQDQDQDQDEDQDGLHSSNGGPDLGWVNELVM